MTLYDLLNIPINSSDDEIKKAYKKLAKKYHPDVNKDGQNMFVRINNAYTILSDPVQKIKYDMMISNSSTKTVDIFANGNADPNSYYSESDLWHQSFMRNNKPTKEWTFGKNDYYIQHNNFYNYQPTTQNITSINGLEAFLDPDISLAFYQIFKTNSIDNQIFNNLMYKPEINFHNIHVDNLIEFIKFKYDYQTWLKCKRFLNVEMILEVTEDEIKFGKEFKIPIKIKVINNKYSYDLWHEEIKNYVFNIPKNTKNNEIMEFFNKGNKALGWQGNLIITINVVPEIINRLKIYTNIFKPDYHKLWFVVDGRETDNPNNVFFDYLSL